MELAEEQPLVAYGTLLTGSKFLPMMSTLQLVEELGALWLELVPHWEGYHNFRPCLGRTG